MLSGQLQMEHRAILQRHSRDSTLRTAQITSNVASAAARQRAHATRCASISESTTSISRISETVFERSHTSVVSRDRHYLSSPSGLTDSRAYPLHISAPWQ